MSLFNRLKKNVRDVFDANTESDQAKRVAQGKPAQYEGSGYRSPASIGYGLVKKATPMGFRDTFDANTESDQLKRAKSTLSPFRVPTSYADEQKMKGNNRPNQNLAQAVGSNSLRVANTVYNYNKDTLPRATVAIGGKIGNRLGLVSDKTYSNLADYLTKGSTDMYKDTGGAFNAGTLFNNPNELKNAGFGTVAKKSLAYGAGTFGELSPVKAPGGIVKRTLMGAGEASIGDAGSQLANNGKVNWKQNAQSAGFGAALPNVVPTIKGTPNAIRGVGNAVSDKRLTDADVSGLLKIKQGRGGFMDNAEYTQALASVKKAGIDTTKPESWGQIDKIISDYNQVLEGRGDSSKFNMGQSRFKPTPLNQGGYVKVPSGAKDPAPDLSPQQKDYINEYANMIEDMGTGNGVAINKATGTRVSSNIRDADTSGKNMTKYDWFNKARSDIESGKAIYGAGEGYLEVPKLSKTPLDAPTTQGQTPLTDSQVVRPIINAKRSSSKIPVRKITPEGGTEIPSIPSQRMSKAEFDSLASTVPTGTEMPIKVAKPNSGSNIPVSKVTQDGDLVTKTNVNPNVKKGEKRFTLGDDGNLIEDKTGAYSIFSDEEGKVTGFRIGNEYHSSKDLGDLSDVNDYGSSLATMRRNVERSFGKETSDKVQRFLVDDQQARATSMIDRRVQYKKGLEDIQKDLGISGGNKESKKVSAAIQDFGENRRTKQSLIDEYGAERANKIVEADKWFRKQYDTLLDEANETLTKFGYDAIPKRKNYYTHFSDESLWAKFGLKMQEIANFGSPTMQDANPSGARGKISNSLAGQSEYMLPNKKFNPFALQRKGDSRTSDAFQSFERYLTPTLNNIYMTPSITRARVLAKAIAQDADLAGKDANGVVIQVREWANRLAGKSNSIGDRRLSDSNWGRKYLTATDWMQKKAGMNSIVGNLNTAIMQPIVLTQATGKFGYKNTLLGTMQMMSGNDASKSSPFLRRRYADTDSVMKTGLQKSADIANKPLNIVERTATEITWNSALNDAKSKGLKGDEAIRYADIEAEKTVAGRSVGEKPEAFESKSAGLVTMYQLEVNNYWQQVGKEMIGKGKIGQAGKVFASAYALNLLLQEVTGRQVGFNPIDAAIDSYDETQKDGKSNVDKAKAIGQRWLGEGVDNTPFVAPLANASIGDRKLRSILGQSSNVGRFGVSSPISALLSTTKVGGVPVPQNLVMPFGGAQTKKTYEGINTLRDGAVKDKNGKVLVEVPRNPANIVRGTLFGKNAIPEVNQYYNNIGQKKVDQKPVQNQTTSVASRQDVMTPDQEQLLRDLPKEKQQAYREAINSGNVSDSGQAKKLPEVGLTQKETNKLEKITTNNQKRKSDGAQLGISQPSIDMMAKYDRLSPDAKARLKANKDENIKLKTAELEWGLAKGTLSELAVSRRVNELDKLKGISKAKSKKSGSKGTGKKGRKQGLPNFKDIGLVKTPKLKVGAPRVAKATVRRGAFQKRA